MKNQAILVFAGLVATALGQGFGGLEVENGFGGLQGLQNGNIL